MSRLLLLAILLLTAACDGEYTRRNRNAELALAECQQKAGVMVGDACFKVDSALPLTGPRISPLQAKP